MTYARDFAWQQRFIPDVRQIIGPLLLIPAPWHMDVKRAADLIILQTGTNHTIAVRLRRQVFYTYGLDYTIRSYRASGAETELSKIRKGWGDWFFYGHVEEVPE